MATSADVENALVSLIGSAVYPSPAPPGTPQVSVARGWPTEADVQKAVQSGASIIGVYAAPGMARDTTRLLRRWETVTQAAPTITATATDYVAALGGSVSAGNIIGIAVSGIAYTAAAQSTDTLSSLAASLAAQIPGATASGATITCPAPPAVVVVNGGTAAVQVSRIDQVFHADLWAPEPAQRDALLAQIEPALKFNPRYAMPDGSTAMLMHMQSNGPNDRPSRASEWAQCIAVTMRYATLYSQAQAAVAATILNLTGGTGANVVQPFTFDFTADFGGYGSGISKQSV